MMNKKPELKQEQKAIATEDQKLKKKKPLDDNDLVQSGGLTLTVSIGHEQETNTY